MHVKNYLFCVVLCNVIAAAPLEFNIAVGCEGKVALRCVHNLATHAFSRPLPVECELEFLGAEDRTVNATRCTTEVDRLPEDGIYVELARIERAFQRHEDEVRELFGPGVHDTSQVVPSGELWEVDGEQDQEVSLLSWIFVNRVALPQNVESAIVVHRLAWEECKRVRIRPDKSADRVPNPE